MSFHAASRTQRSTNAESAASSGGLQRIWKSDLNRQQSTDWPKNRSAPPIVNDVIHSPGRPLDNGERAFMESRFNHDFSNVQVHTDEQAAQSARAVKARAYAVENNIVFGEGQYQPASGQGRRLLAHELAHVVQQERAGIGAEAEAHADQAADRVAGNQTLLPGAVGATAPGLYADNGEAEETPAASPSLETQTAFSLGWTDMARIGVFELTPPLLLTPPPRRLSLGSPLLSSPTSPRLNVPGLPPPTLSLTEPTLESPGSSAMTAPPTETQEEASAPSLPSRIPVHSSGRFSLGLRLGFPEVEPQRVPGMPESPLAESLRRAEIMNQVLSGNVPSGWEATDKGKLAQAIWGIFSTNIAPDLARSITSSLSTPAGPAGVSYELDLVLITDFSDDIGGGLSFTVRFPSFESLFTGR